MNQEMRRSTPLFSMNVVMKLTDLTARQIRYYEEQQLILPNRSEGNRRLFSLNDIDRLLEIKDLIDKGLNIAGVRQIIGNQDSSFSEADIKPLVQQNSHQEAPKKTLTDEQLRKILKEGLIQYSEKRKPSDEIMRRGDMWRFFKP